MTEHPDPFLEAFDGKFIGIRQWDHLDDLWKTMTDQAGEQRWYAYAVGETPPTEPLDRDHLAGFITGLDELLRRDHDESYCGIVYADDPKRPSFIKIYDPNHLGAACGSSGSKVLPGWVLSGLRPTDLPMAFPQPGGRRRWWQRLLGNTSSQ